MKPELWAVCTALCWSVGAFFEKRGVKLGDLTPVMGTGVRTAASLLALSFLSYPYWGELKTAGLKPLLMVALGGGLLAGAFGIICLYSGLKSGHLATVSTIAFCLTPAIGTILGVCVLKERLALMQCLGIALCISGASLAVYFKH